jgi:hypothetical protein
MVTLAEGIETEQELAFLRERGLPARPGLLLLEAGARPKRSSRTPFGGIPGAEALRSRLTPISPECVRGPVRAIPSASIPAHAPAAPPGSRSRHVGDASFITRPWAVPRAARASRTASPEPAFDPVVLDHDERGPSGRAPPGGSSSIGFTL